MGVNKRLMTQSATGAGHTKGTVVISRGTYQSSFALSANTPANPTNFTTFGTHSYYIGIIPLYNGIVFATSQGNAQFRGADENGLTGSNQAVVSPFSNWWYGGLSNGTVTVAGGRTSPYFAYKSDATVNSGSWTGKTPGGEVFYGGIGYTGSHWVTGAGNKPTSIKPVYYTGGATPNTAITWTSHPTPGSYGGFSGFDVDEVNGNMCTTMGRLSNNKLHFWNGTDPSTATLSHTVNLNTSGWANNVVHNGTCWVGTTDAGYHFSNGMTPSSSSDWTPVTHSFGGVFRTIVWDGDTWWRMNGATGVQFCTDAQLSTSSTWTSVTVPGSGNTVFHLAVIGTTYQHGVPRNTVF
jgi:hypothetical protein